MKSAREKKKRGPPWTHWPPTKARLKHYILIALQSNRIAIRSSKLHFIKNSTLKKRIRSCMIIKIQTDLIGSTHPAIDSHERYCLQRHSLAPDFISFIPTCYLPSLTIDKCRAGQVFTGILGFPDKRSRGLYLAYHLRGPLKLLNSICDFISSSS